MKAVAPKPKASGKTIAVIMKAAAEEFAQHGFAGARVDSIAGRAQVNKATIYYHIGDKAILYKEVLIGVLGRIADELDEKIDNVSSAEDKLKAYICAISTNITSSRLFSPIIMREIASGGENLPKEVEGKMSHIISRLTAILKQGAKSGELKGAEPRLIHLLIIGGLNFYVAGEPICKKVFTDQRDGAECGEETYEDLGTRIAGVIINGLKG